MRTVELKKIRIDGGTQCRVVIDQKMVQNYVECMQEGDKFPPMYCYYDGSDYWLVDGFHRWHAYSVLNVKGVEIEYKPGTLDEARIASYGQNAHHGLPRSNADKRRSVEMALADPNLQGKSNYEIAKICAVSQPFVATVRNPERAEAQQKAREKSVAKKTTNPISSLDSGHTNPISNDSVGPDAKEEAALDAALQRDQESISKLLDADDALDEAFQEIKRLNALVSSQELRIKSLMIEKNEAVKMVKDLQKQLEKARK